MPSTTVCVCKGLTCVQTVKEETNVYLWCLFYIIFKLSLKTDWHLGSDTSRDLRCYKTGGEKKVIEVFLKRHVAWQ